MKTDEGKMSKDGTVFGSKVVSLNLEFKDGLIIARCEAYPEMLIVAKDWVELAKDVEASVWAIEKARQDGASPPLCA